MLLRNANPASTPLERPFDRRSDRARLIGLFILLVAVAGFMAVSAWVLPIAPTDPTVPVVVPTTYGPPPATMGR